MASYTPNEKVDVMEAEMVNASDRSGKVEFDDGKGIRAVPGTTLESFSHLDEKKILRKVRCSTLTQFMLLIKCCRWICG
jgi:hypothetical protein